MSVDLRTKALLDAARPGFEPRAEDASRNEAALMAAIGGTVASATIATKLTKALTTTLPAKAIAGVVLLSTIGLGGVIVASRPASPAQAAAAPQSLVSPAPPSSVSPPALDATSPAGPTPPPARSQTVRAAPAVTKPPKHAAIESSARGPSPSATGGASSRIDYEVALVRDGAARLNSGDPARALAAFDEHARAFPDGTLAEERSAGRARALCALGRIAEARAEAARLLAAHPDSPHAPSIRCSP